MPSKPDTEKIEIVKQVRLTPKQVLTLMEISNAGGSLPRVDHDTRTVLTHLGLIVERPRWTEVEKQKRVSKRAENWKKLKTLVANGSLQAVENLVRDMHSDAYSDNDKAWFLTKAAQEYLSNGTVTIKRGRQEPAK